MTRFAKLLIGSALTVLLAGNGFAADATPEASKPAAPAATAPAPSTAAPAQPAAAPAPATAAQPAAAMAPEVKLGYVTASRIATESAEGKASAATLKAKSEKLKAKIEARQKALEKLKSAAEAKLPTMSPTERAAKGKELQKKFEDWQKLVRSSETEMQELQDKLMTELYQKIKKASADYAMANGYTALIEEKAVLYIVDTIRPKDVTDDIVELLNQKKPSK
ncbi:MAG TPA: porin [Geobacter sp.]|nr:porin [Geobacter sp.]